jgi:hypothetical protein
MFGADFTSFFLPRKVKTVPRLTHCSHSDKLPHISRWIQMPFPTNQSLVLGEHATTEREGKGRKKGKGSSV